MNRYRMTLAAIMIGASIWLSPNGLAQNFGLSDDGFTMLVTVEEDAEIGVQNTSTGALFMNESFVPPEVTIIDINVTNGATLEITDRRGNNRPTIDNTNVQIIFITTNGSVSVHGIDMPGVSIHVSAETGVSSLKASGVEFSVLSSNAGIRRIELNNSSFSFGIFVTGNEVSISACSSSQCNVQTNSIGTTSPDILIDECDFQTCDLLGGSGRDRIRIVDTSIRMFSTHTGQHDDRLEFNRSVIADANIEMDNGNGRQGNDYVYSTASRLNNCEINTGELEDTVVIFGSALTGTTRLNMGSERDFGFIYGGTIRQLIAQMGEGNDVLALHGANLSANHRTSLLKAGTGDDRLTIRRRDQDHFSHYGFETVDDR